MVTVAAVTCLQIEKLFVAKDHGCYDVVHWHEACESVFRIFSTILAVTAVYCKQSDLYICLTLSTRKAEKPASPTITNSREAEIPACRCLTYFRKDEISAW